MNLRYTTRNENIFLDSSFILHLSSFSEERLRKNEDPANSIQLSADGRPPARRLDLYPGRRSGLEFNLSASGPNQKFLG